MMFTVHRMVGSGDLEHVRASMLQVSALDPYCLIEQAKAAFKLGDRLNMMVRLHVNSDVLGPVLYNELMDLFRHNQTHQLELWEKLTRDQLAEKMNRCEFIIETDTTQPRTRRGDETAKVRCEADTLYDMMLYLWLAHPRPEGGNFARLTKDQMVAVHPELGGDVV